MRVLRVATGLAALLTVVSSPRPASGQGLMVTGYADFEASITGVGSNNSGFFFDNHHFNVIAVGKLVDNLFAAAEVEYEHAGDEIALEYGYLSYTGVKNVTISAGKFIVPFGRFNKDLHPTWINKMPDSPLGFRNIMPGTYSDVGVWVAGSAPIGQVGARVTYDVFVVNGLLGADGGDIRGMRDNVDESLSGGGRDKDKSFGGRLGLDFAPQGFDIGASIYTGNYLDDPVNNLTLTLFGVDAAFVRDALELRAEGVIADQSATGGDLTKKGGYVQAAYGLQGGFEPVVRFSIRDMPSDADDMNRLSFGLNYYIFANSSVRLAYHINREKTGFASENNNLVAQFNVVF